MLVVTKSSLVCKKRFSRKHKFVDRQTDGQTDERI